MGAFGGKELSTTMNADERVARGCALQAAILSPLYKVRDFKVEDTTPFGINVGWLGTAGDADVQDDDGDSQMTVSEGENKCATVFPAGSLMGTTKMLTFMRKGPFQITAEYVDEKILLPFTPKALGVYKVDLPPQKEAKKVKVKAKLTLHGTFVIDNAQMVEDEEYEETVKEKRELPAEPAPEVVETPEGSPTAEPNGDVPMPDQTDKGEGDGKKEAPAPKEPEKKYEWVDVVKKRKRTKRTDVNVIPSGTPGLSADVLQKFMDEETAMQAEMRDIIETDEKRNDLESYIFNMRDKTAESGDYGNFISSTDREKFSEDLTKAEDWLYDNSDATKAMYIEKLDELKLIGDSVAWRAKEHSIRDEWIAAVAGTVSNYRQAAENPGEKYGHIAPEKLQKIVQACSDLENWLKENQVKQAALKNHEKPVLLCAEMEKRKPTPPKEEKVEEKVPELSKDENKSPDSEKGP